MYTAASLLALTLVLLPAAEIRRRHTSCEMDGGCLTFRSPTGEKKLLANARQILASEIVLVEGIPEEEAMSMIDKAV